MLNWLIDLISGNYNEKEIAKLTQIVEQINNFEMELQKLSEIDLKNKTDEFKSRLANGESLNDLLVEVFAVVKNACRRLVGTKYGSKEQPKVRDMIPYDVQLVGGMILHHGKIAEMKTGEGKTLVAVLPLYLNALTGKGVYLVTVNDYLASRDAEQMSLVYEYLGMTVGSITKSVPLEKRRDQYSKDIIYIENSELGFDYLRDNLTKSMSERNFLWRKPYFAVIDEVDSILIDEARTPLIISQPDSESTDKYTYYAKIIQTLVPAKGKKKVKKGFLAELLDDTKKAANDNGHVENDQDDQKGDYFIDEKAKTALLSSEGISNLEKMLGVENLYRDLGYEEIHHIENALKAQSCYSKDKEYIVKDGEILIVDEHTGRIMSGRRFSEGLHQSIEAKEGVQVKRESKTLATITYQNFFKTFEKISGMTGTATTEGEEFDKIYELGVLSVPTNRPTIRVDKTDKVYFSQKPKRKYISEDIEFAHSMGQPILIGTSSIQSSEYMSDILRHKNINHYVLNAKYHEQEANIISNAGKFQSVVVATNMAGRGTDIKPEPGLNAKIAKNYAKRILDRKRYSIQDRFDFIANKNKKNKIGLKLNVFSEIEYNLLLDALFGNVDPTSEDKIASSNLSKTDTPKKFKNHSTVSQGEDSFFYTQIQSKTGFESDGFIFKSKLNTKRKPGQIYVEIYILDKVKNDNIDKFPKKIDEDEFVIQDIHFGLFILGTEKHESRRIDNQLRGRSGRQGDPGISIFYVAVDDMIMRKMGGDKIQSMATFMPGMSKEILENIELTQKQFTSSIETAQKQMEARHFGIRKHLFDYDSVIDKQRQAIYGKRDKILGMLENKKEL